MERVPLDIFVDGPQCRLRHHLIRPEPALGRDATRVGTFSHGGEKARKPRVNSGALLPSLGEGRAKRRMRGARSQHSGHAIHREHPPHSLDGERRIGQHPRFVRKPEQLGQVQQ